MFKKKAKYEDAVFTREKTVLYIPIPDILRAYGVEVPEERMDHHYNVVRHPTMEGAAEPWDNQCLRIEWEE